MRELLAELQKAQQESDGLVRKARTDVAEAIGGGELRPVGTSGGPAQRGKKKTGRKKR